MLPTAVSKVAPVGLRLHWLYPAQGLVALSGLRTLGFGLVAPMGAELHGVLDGWLGQACLALPGLRDDLVASPLSS